jgi:hypothetical protein
MLSSTQHQSWLFYMPLAKQAALLKDDLLEPIDQLLDDTQLIELVRNCPAARSPASTRTGMAADRLLRCCVLKHLKGSGLLQLLPSRPIATPAHFAERPPFHSRPAISPLSYSAIRKRQRADQLPTRIAKSYSWPKFREIVRLPLEPDA